MSYYAEKLSGPRLKQCYDLAPARIERYLRAELDFVLEQTMTDCELLELGCGYGRLFPDLCRKAGIVIGVDNSLDSLRFAREYLAQPINFFLACMDAAHLGIRDDSFDVVVCVQNGISAFHVDQRRLIEEAWRVCRPTGLVLFSTYSEKIWDARLDWFKLQAEAGLLGEIDYEKTGDGVIVCKDGFSATTVSADRFHELTLGFEAEVKIREVDESSLFCVLRKFA